MRHLQSILAGTEAFLGKQLNIHSSHYDADLSLCLDYCKSIVLLVAECTGHIHGGLLGLHSVQDDSIGADGTHLLENGREVVLVLSRTMFSLCDKLVAYTDHTMKTLHRNHIHRDCMIKFTREILASSMSFWTTIVVEKLTQDPSVEANFEQLLRSTLEQSILMSRFENFSGGHRDEVLAEIEAINDYR